MATFVGNASGNSLSGGSAPDQLSGNGGNDTLRGGAGNDSLYGATGNDLLDGGAGTDMLDGGAGLDTVDYSTLTLALLADLAGGTASFAAGVWAAERLSSIEGVRAGSGDDTVLGTGGADSVDGGGGSDSLVGQAGNDTLLGGAGNDDISGGSGTDSLVGGDGNDTLWGGGGKDTLNGGTGIDRAIYAEATTALLVDLRAGRASFTGTNWPDETLVSIEGAAAGSGNDTLIGTAGANDLSGGAGNDSLAGGNGKDILFGEDGNDIVQGGGGNDTLVAGTTRFETFYEEDMRDGDFELMNSWLVDDGADTLDGGAGVDTLLIRVVSFGEYHFRPYELADARVDLTLGTLRMSLPGARADRLISIENVVASGGNDTILGSSGANRIETGKGVNLVLAGGGNDTIVGGAYARYDDVPEGYSDRLYGEGGDDLIQGGGAIVEDYWDGTGTDYLDGGDGSDTLIGGDGRAYMIGGAGADAFVFDNVVGYYGYEGAEPRGPMGTIEDFDRAEGDRIRIALTDPDFAGTPRYIGEVGSTAEIGAFELGFLRVSDESGQTHTLLRFANVGRDEDGSWFSADRTSLDITLTGYTGTLTASDIIFL